MKRKIHLKRGRMVWPNKHFLNFVKTRVKPIFDTEGPTWTTFVFLLLPQTLSSWSLASFLGPRVGLVLATSLHLPSSIHRLASGKATTTAENTWLRVAAVLKSAVWLFYGFYVFAIYSVSLHCSIPTFKQKKGFSYKYCGCGAYFTTIDHKPDGSAVDCQHYYLHLSVVW